VKNNESDVLLSLLLLLLSCVLGQLGVCNTFSLIASLTVDIGLVPEYLFCLVICLLSG